VYAGAIVTQQAGTHHRISKKNIPPRQNKKKPVFSIENKKKQDTTRFFKKIKPSRAPQQTKNIRKTT